jgi:glutamate 5-kinase
MTGKLSNYRRIVVKIGSALLVDLESGVRRTWLESLAADLGAIWERGGEIIIVSSGSIALGRRQMSTHDASLAGRALKLEESQAAAAVGQIALGRVWSEMLGDYGMQAGQILLTLGDTEERRRYLNARDTIGQLLAWRSVPIINENDTVATNEIRYGDNDRLAARVASMMDANLLVLLSDIDGLYTAPPSEDPNAKLLETVDAITPEIEAMAGESASVISSGGMRTKIAAAKIATQAGTEMVIASGKVPHPLKELDQGGRSTWFAASKNPINNRRRWIAGTLETSGALTIDAGAITALKSGKSLLPAGVTDVKGEFSRGDTVLILDSGGRTIGRGLVEYDFEDAKKSKGRSSDELTKSLGESYRSVLIHRDDMVIE